MSQQPLVAPNQLAASIRLLRPTPPATRLTVWPFVALYAVLAALLADPTMLWPAWAYEDYAAFIDFFHAVSIPAVAILHALSWFLTKWVVAFGAFVNYTDVGHDTKEATHCLVVPMPHKGETHIAPIAQLPSGSRRRYFEYQQCKFFFDGTVFSPPTYPDSLPVQTYFDQLAQGGLGAVKDGVTDTVAVAAVIEAQLERFGPNYAENRIPDFQTVLFDHLVSPFYVFQIFCVLLLVLDEYWLFAVFNGFMITMLECIQVMQRRRSMQSMNDMGSCPPFPVDVRRNGKVVTVSCRDLLPLDVVHLTFTGSQQCVVPADMVLVRGSAVVNEAMLTGESTPQMKEGLPPVSMSTANAMAEPLCPRLHGHHMVFGGTQILSASAGGSGADSSGNDGGSSAASSAGLPDVAIGIVIRTGFETKQGELIRTIQHSQRRVAQNAGEAFALIGVLLCFAIAASVYVLQRGLANPTKSRWKLFLTCTQILTTVVPPELPLQLTLAATQSMMALMKMNIFCTEPFRIPVAGKVDTCCFDKTGTITTDEMLFYGVDMVDGHGTRRLPSAAAPVAGTKPNSPAPSSNASNWLNPRSEMVLAGCHSLVGIDAENSAGDAMEKACVDSLGWRITRPGYLVKGEGSRARRSLSIVTRFLFNPVLRRMSCIIGDEHGEKFSVVKGSPEAMRPLFRFVPDEYPSACRRLTMAGFRVIALGYREIPLAQRSKAALDELTRDDVERELLFAGFAVFECPLKKDAKETMSQLTKSQHRLAMITGDNLQTAVAVAREIDMLLVKGVPSTSSCSSSAGGGDARGGRARVLVAVPTSGAIDRAAAFGGATASALSTLVGWRDVDEDEGPLVDQPSKDDELCVDADLLKSDDILNAILGPRSPYAERIVVWARSAPHQKEAIIGCLKTHHHSIVLMAGDGTNDMGGLKQADVGVAVLNSALVLQNMSAASSNGSPPAVAGTVAASSVTSAGGTQVTLTPGPYPYLPVPPEPANPGQDAPFTVQMKYQFAMAKRNAAVLQNQRIEKLNQQGGDARKKQQDAALQAKERMESVFNSMLEEDKTGGIPVVKLGDASIAAPFTCKSRRLTALCDILRLGRATIATTMQMYKIMAINCLVSAYSMGVLFSDGVKFGQAQQIASSIVITATYLTFLRAQPLPFLAADRPVGRIFHPYMIVSIFGQFAVHLYSLMQSVELVHSVEPDALMTARGDDADPSADVAPTLLNSIVFLMSLLTMAATFAVNYQGYPFMTPLLKNRPFLYALLANMALVLYLASEYDPETNEMLGIVKFPSDEFRMQLFYLISMDVLGSFLVEKVARLTLGRWIR